MKEETLESAVSEFEVWLGPSSLCSHPGHFSIYFSIYFSISVLNPMKIIPYFNEAEASCVRCTIVLSTLNSGK